MCPIRSVVTLLFALALPLQAQEKETHEKPLSPSSTDSATSTPGEWPRFQGPRGNGTTPEAGWLAQWPEHGEPKTAWSSNLGLGLAGFAVAKRRVYSAGNDGHEKDTVWCLDLETGNVIWKHELAVPTKCHTMPIVPYGPAATPTVVDGIVYSLSRAGHLLALDAVSGKTHWTLHLIDDLGGVAPVYGYASSPAIEGDRLFLDIGQKEPGSNKGSTVCLDRNDGSVLWQTGEGQAGYATPFVGKIKGRELLVIFKGEALELREPENGELVSRYATTTRDFCNCATPMIFGGDTIIISHTGKSGTRGMQFDGSALKERWDLEGHGLLFHSGTPFSGKLIAFNDESRNENTLKLIDPDNGSIIWKSDDFPKGNLIVCDDGTALVLGKNGELVAARVSSEGVKPLHRMQVFGGKTYVQPTLADRRILCRNNDGKVVCLDLR